MRVGLIQINSQEDRAHNVARALELVAQAARGGAQLVVLPEYVTYLGRAEYQWDNAEDLGGPSSQAFAAAAHEYGVYLLAGTIPERTATTGKSSNTSQLFDPHGERIATYRKIHLFDVDVSGAGSYRESDTLVPGDEAVVAPVGETKLGMTICYDLRFPELYRTLALQGAEILAVPAAFTLFTGRDHWEVLLRARAIENQCYVIAAAQWGTHPVGRACFGRSMVIDPWGTVIAQAADGEGVVLADLDLARLRTIRRELPSLANRRPATYRV